MILRIKNKLFIKAVNLINIFDKKDNLRNNIEKLTTEEN